MAKPKRPRDPNQLAKLIVDIATGNENQSAPVLTEAQRRAGIKGGQRRAATLTERRRSEIASAAAKARWAKKD
jgi:hypothetical protein